MAATAVVIAGGLGVAVADLTGGDGRGDATSLDAGIGAPSPTSAADAALIRWADGNGKSFRRHRSRQRPRPTTTTTAAATPTSASVPTPGGTEPPPAGPSTSVTSTPAPPASDATTTSSSRVTTAPTSAPGSSSSNPPGPTTTTTAQPTTTTAKPTTTVKPPPTVKPPVTTPPSGGGQVVWQDNFDQLDTSHWALEHSTYGDGNKELQCYRPENVAVSGGKLVLRAVTETYTCPNGSTRQVTSGMVRSRGVTFSPGQALEFRVKLTPANDADQGGLWPGVWSSGFGGGAWPAGGEMDYLEVMTATNPKRSIYSIHYAKADGSHGVSNKPVVGADNFSAAWHSIRYEYGLDGRLAWYLDGQLVFSVSSAPTGQGYPAPFNQPVKEIKINLALGGNPGPLAPGAVGAKGATFEVDYIRITTL